LTVHLPLHHNRLLRNKKGYSGLIATIFMVLVVIYLYTSVFSVIQDQNLNFQDATSQSQQLDADRNAEKVSISDVRCEQAAVTFTIKNCGALPVRIERVWVLNPNETALSFPLNIVLASGIEKPNVSVSISGASVDSVFWVVTYRGNLFFSGGT
jgi:hypothetical protein